MGWKILLIEKRQKLFVENNLLIVHDQENERKLSFHFEDLDVVIIDNLYSFVTLFVINKLIEYQVTLIINDIKHDPFSFVLGFSGHHRPLQNLSKQIDLSKRTKQRLWQQIIQQKIKNQLLVMEAIGSEKEKLEKMQIFEKSVLRNDQHNREAIAAKVFFSALYGFNFVRFTDDPINHSLNYGYKILASRISSALVKYGLQPSFGIHHHSKDNYFNLTYDLIEPFRPLIDYITHCNNDLLVESERLNIDLRLKHVEVLNHYVLIDNKMMRIRNAIDYMAKSFISILREESKDLILPELILDQEGIDDDI